MMNKLAKILFIIAIGISFCTCSTQKNTGATRSFHQTKCKYNIDFNAMNSYKEGMKKLNSSDNDDYTHRIKMYPISNIANQELAKSEMDVVILKCRKAIKTHSITRKPKKDIKRSKDEKYMYFYNQEEYIQGVKDAWVLLGKAEIHKGDFMGAIATFNYILRHYPSDKIVNCRAKIWQARAYAEAGWLYEAQQEFESIKPDEVNYKVMPEYTATKAFLLLEAGEDNEAIPFLESAIRNENDRYLRARWNMLIGQILFGQGKKNEAIPYLKEAVKKSQSYQLEFNAKIMLLQSEGNGNSLKKLDKMAKNYNNKDYLDQVYCAIGNIHLANGDTAKALEAYKQGVEQSTKDGVEKATVLITMGDIYYKQKAYSNAQPCYSEAANLIDNTHDDYRRVSKLGQTLDQFVLYHNTITLQDSLQYLSTLSEPEQRAIIDEVIKVQRAKDSIEAQKLIDAETKGFQESVRPDMNIRTGNQEWYFYNQQLIAKGKTLFTNKWGNRVLEDDWRRSSKFVVGNSAMTDSDNQQNSDKKNDKESKEGEEIKENELYDPDFYFAQIPQTPEDIENSNMLISDAMYKLATLYDEKLEEYELSAEEHEQFQNRFPKDKMNIESLYASYRLGLKLNDEEMTERYRNEIVRRYPQSTYALVLTDSNYVTRTKKMLIIEDSIYRNTYKAFTENNFAKVRSDYQMMLKNYPTSSLIDRFAFLNTLTIGKSGNSESFAAELEDLVSKYPDSQVAPACRDILALMNQGEKAKRGTDTKALTEMREKNDEEEKDKAQREFTRIDDSKHALIIVLEGKTKKQANTILYDVAAYNFTRFMVNTYDLESRVIDGNETIIVSEFESRTGAEWYYNKLMTESTIRGSQMVIISVDDLGIIGKIRTLNEYLQKQP